MIGRPSASPIMLKVAAMVLLPLVMSSPIFGATLTVNSTADDNDSIWGNGHDTLREAISYASPDDTIQFSTTGTITLISTLPTIAKNLTIAGPGAALLTVSGNHSCRVLMVSGGAVSISGLTIRDGQLFGTGDTGAGVHISGATVTIASCRIEGCRILAADSTGAAIAVLAGATLNLTDCAVTDNQAERGGAITSSGTANVTSCTVSGNSSGALGVGGGGVVYNAGGIMSVSSCTITGNAALNYEGGLLMCGGATLLRNSIVAGNTALDGQGDVDLSSSLAPSETITSEGYNIVGVNDGPYAAFTPTTGDRTGTSAAPVVALLGALQDNGGPTPTHALLPGSPAIDAIPGCNDAPAADQRGIARPQYGACDIGAFEAQDAAGRPLPTAVGEGLALLACLLAIGGFLALRRAGC